MRLQNVLKVGMVIVQLNHFAGALHAECSSAPAGLVSWWRADGNALDAGGNNNGTLEGNAAFAPGLVGQAFSFDGDSDGVTFGNPAGLQLQNFTIEAWVKRADTNLASLDPVFTAGCVLGYGYGGYNFVVRNNGRLSLGKVGIAAVDSNVTVKDTNWHHVAVTKAAGTVVFYVDGVGETTPPFDPGFTFASDVQIGAFQWSGTQPQGSFLGLIDEVSIYNRALTGAEIGAVFTAGSAGKCQVAKVTIDPNGGVFANSVTVSLTEGSTSGSVFYTLDGSEPTTNALPYTAAFGLTNTTTVKAAVFEGGSRVSDVASAVFIVLNSSGNCIALPDLVSWWKGEGNGTDSVGSNNGTLEGNAAFAPGLVGQAFSFDGDSDGVTFGNPAGLQLQNFTIEAWVKRADTNLASLDPVFTAGCVLGYGYGGYNFVVRNNGRLSLGKVGIAAVDSNVTVKDTNWHHVAVTKAAGTVVFYVDGVGETTPPFDPGFTFASDVQIGAFQWSGTQPQGSFLGLIDEVSIYNRALTGAEIGAVFTAGSAGKCALPPPAGPFANGSFETPVFSPGGHGLPSGSTDITHWVTGGPGTVSIINGPASPSVNPEDGTQHIDFNGGDTVSGATLSQTFDTIIGQTYTVSFYVGRVGASGGTMSLQAKVTSGTAVVLGSLAATAPDAQGYGSAQIFTFTATTTSSTLTFTDTSTATTAVDLLLDNVSVTANTECSPVPSGLVSWWRAEANALDTGGNNNGTLGGNSTFASGRVGQAFSFDGSGDGIRIGNPANLRLQDFTIEAWVKRGSATQVSASSIFGEIVGYGWGGYVFGFWSDGHLFLSKNGVDNVSSTHAITDTDWHHLAVAKSGNKTVFYIDGVGEPEQTYNTTYEFNTDLVIGAVNGSFDASFLGLIDELSIYNRGLTATEVQSIYNAGSAGKCPPAAVGPFTNGSFELPPIAGGATENLSAGRASLPGWTVGDTSVVALANGPRNGVDPVDGSQYIGFNGGNTPAGGWISQTFATTVGQTYTVSFYVARLFSGSGTMSLQAGVTSGTGTLLGSLTATAPDTQGYGPIQTFNFTATTASSTLKFTDASTATIAVDLLLDNVRVEAGNGTCVAPPDGLVSWWPGEGNANDVLGANNGTLGGGTSFTAGEVGQAFSFNGTDSQVSFGNSVGNFGTNDFTVEFWMRTTSTRHESVIAKREACSVWGSGWVVWIGSTSPWSGPGRLEAAMTTDDSGSDMNAISAGRAINDGLFHHVAFVRRGTNLLFYIDGVADVATNVLSGLVNHINNTANLVVGGSVCEQSGVHPFTGQMDEVAVYNRALSESEIQAIYNAGSVGKCAPPAVGPFTNGSFESPVFPSGGHGFPSGSTNIDHWITGGPGTVSIVNGPASPSVNPEDGAQHIDFNGGDTVSGATLSQTFDTTVGQAYSVSFYVGRAGSGGTMSLQADVTSGTGAVLGSLTAVAPDTQGYGPIQTFNFTATTASSTLKFTDTSTATVAVDLLLDNVTVRTSSPPVGPFANGSFESPALPTGSSVDLHAGSTELIGWAIGNTGLVSWRNGPAYGVAPVDGSQEIGFNGGNTPPGGSVSQTFLTSVGRTYIVRFNLGRQGPGSGTMKLQAEVKSADGDVLSSVEAVAPQAPGYGPSQAFGFVATTTNSTLTFTDTSSATVAVDLLLDNVTVAEAIPVDGKSLAHWKFDETDGTTAHDSAGTYDGALSASGASFAPGGISGNAISLSKANNGFVNMGNVLGLESGDFSVVAWVKMNPGDTTESTTIVSKQRTGYANGYVLAANFSGGPTGGYAQPDKAWFYDSDYHGQEVISTTSVNDGNWHQIVGVYVAGGNKSIYVDGAPAEASNASRPIVANPGQFIIGGDDFDGTPGGMFTGLIDDVQIYNYAIGAADIDFLFNNPGEVVPEHELPVGWVVKTTVIGNGSIAHDPDLERYPNGTNVTLTAVPGAGFRFAGWAGGVTGTNNPITLIVNGDKSITASFVDIAPPAVVITSPVAGTVADDSFQLSGSVADNVRVVSARWEWNGQPAGPLSLSSNQFSVSGLHLYQGENRIRVIARDAAGNEGAAEVVVTWQPKARALAHWTFDETDGTVAHDTAGTNDGVLSTNGASFASGGISGNAISLSKTNNGFVNMGNVLGLTIGDFSLVTWIRMNAGDTSDTSIVMSKHAASTRNGYILNVNKTGGLLMDNKAAFIEGGTGVGQITVSETPISTTSVNDGGWHQIVAVYQAGGNKLIYVDGAPAEDSKPSQDFNANSVALVIGGVNFDGTPTGMFTGLIDEVEVYNYALTGTDVDFLFNNPSQVIPEHDLPVGWSLNTAASTGGTIQRNPDLARYPDGTNVTLTAVADAGFAFKGWSGDATGITNPLTVTMNGNKTITASFAEIPARILAVVNPDPKQEGQKINFDLQLTSQGGVGGMSFVLHYDPNYLKEPKLDWSSVVGSALNLVNYDVPGEIRATFALPATAVPSGTQRIAGVTFRTRSVPFDLDTDLGLELVDVSAPTGNPITSGNAAEDGVARILARHVTGDNNANDRLDSGDATIMQRLLIGLDPVRPWDVTGNDVNASTTLDAGDVIRVLRVVANIDPQPAPHLGGSVKGGLTKSGLGKAGPSGGSTEIAALNADRLRAQAGDLVTVQVVLNNIATTIAGASFTLDYPTNALRLLNSQSLHTGPLAPGNAIALWNVAPAQNDYGVQSGRVFFAISSATAWPTNGGVLAEFVFQVQPDEAAQYRWPIRLSATELTADGYDVRALSDSEIYFVGRDPLPPSLSASSSGMASDGFHLVLGGEAGMPYSIDVSTDLVHWTPLATVTNTTGTLDFVDSDAKNDSQRFYRAVQQF